MRSGYVKDVIVGGLSSSINPRNLLLFLVVSILLVIQFDHSIRSHSHYALGYLASVGSVPPGPPSIWGEYFGMIAVVLSVFFASVVISNSAGGRFVDSVKVSVRKLPRLLVLSFIMLVVILAVNYAVSETLQHYLLEDIIDTSFNSFTAFDGISSGGGLQSLLILMMATAPITVALMLIPFFFVFQEVVIGQKGIFSSLRGSLSTLRSHYDVVALTLFVIILVNYLVTQAFLGVVSYFGTSGDIFIDVMFYFLVVGWLTTFQICVITKAYVRVKKYSEA